jgi:hypothetical protein
LLVGDDAPDEFAAHPVELGGRRFEVLLYFFQREGVIGALIPIALAVDAVEVEADLFRAGAPVRPLLAGDPLHQLEACAPTEWPVEPKPLRDPDPLRVPTEGTEVCERDGEKMERRAVGGLADE